MNGVRGTNGVSFCWQDKRRLNLIRSRTTGKRRASALVVYVTLTNIASDEGDSRFQTYVSVIAEMAGLHRETVSLAMRELEKLGLISTVRQARKADGKYAAIRVTITKGGGHVGLNALKPTRQESQTEATTATAAASVGHPHHVGLNASKPTYRKEQDKEKEVVVTRAREVESLPQTDMIPPRVRSIIEEYLGPLCWNGTNARLVTEWCERYREEHVVRAIEEAAMASIARSRVLGYVRSTLENQEKQGFTWQPKVAERGGLVVVPDDPIV